MHPRFILLFFCFSPFAAVWAQDVPRIRNFPPADYSGQNQNWSLAEAPSGRLYAGNNGGLLEFDGAAWKTYPLPENQTVRTVAADKHGNIFCGGFAEFGFWTEQPTGLLAYHSLSAEVRGEHLDKEEIWHILVADGFVLFQSFSTIYKYDYRTVAVLKPPSSIMFAQQVNGRVYVPVIDRGLFELLPDNTFRFVAGTEALIGKIVQFLVPHGAQGLWAGTTNHGIFQIENNRCIPWKHPLNAVFQQYQLNKAVALRHGGWAVGTILNGVYILDADIGLRFHINRENGLQNNTVLALLEDRQGNLWLGLDRGIDLVALHAPITAMADWSGKIGAVYTAARFQNRLYIGTNQGVFMRAGERFLLLKGSQGQVWQLAEFGGQLLCGHNGGTFLIEGTTARNISGITGGWCLAPVPGRADQLLQSTYTGLVVFQKQPGGGWQIAHRVEGFSEPLKKICFDRRGHLWGCHPNKGLFRLRLSDDLKQVLEYKTFTREAGLPTDFRLDICQIGEKLIVNAQPYPLQIEDSAGRVVFRPIAAARRQKWLPGLAGDYFSVDSSGIALHCAGQAYALPFRLVPGFENIAALDSNTYLFCLENGFALLDKAQLLRRRPYQPSVTIRRIESSNGISRVPTPDMVFPARQNNLRFEFAVPFFEQAPLFSWRLEGFSNGWSPWQSTPVKEFINLPPGAYTMHVRSDAGGSEAIVAFRIAAPWYRGGWALAVYALLLLGFVFFWEKTSRDRLERQRRRLEAEKERELSHQRMEAEHEKLALEVETQSRELSNAAFNLIRKNEVLQHLQEALRQTPGQDPRALQKLARQIDRHLESDHDWEIFEASFNKVHDDFFKRLLHQFPDLTPGDLRLAAYLKMNLSSKEIAPLLNISVRGVENKRYRLRKKLGLPEDANLTEYMIGY